MTLVPAVKGVRSCLSNAVRHVRASDQCGNLLLFTYDSQGYPVTAGFLRLQQGVQCSESF